MTAPDTCGYARMNGRGVIVGCLAAPEFIVRWAWREGAEVDDLATHGAICEGHLVQACQDLANDVDVERDSIEIARFGTVEL